jgi:hypothetical protein
MAAPRAYCTPSRAIRNWLRCPPMCPGWASSRIVYACAVSETKARHSQLRLFYASAAEAGRLRKSSPHPPGWASSSPAGRSLAAHASGMQADTVHHRLRAFEGIGPSEHDLRVPGVGLETRLISLALIAAASRRSSCCSFAPRPASVHHARTKSPGLHLSPYSIERLLPKLRGFSLWR